MIKLQREEAARIRRDKEIERRNLQKKERVERNKLVQKKIYSKVFAKTYLKNLQSDTLKHLISNGIFTKKTQMKIIDIMVEKYFPHAEKMTKRSEINKAIMNKFNENFYKREIINHKLLMDQVFEERKNEAEAKAKEAEDKRLADIEFERAKAERKEAHRVSKFTKIVEETILKSKYDKTDIITVPLADVDDLTQVSSAIHTAGGQFGEFILCVQALLDELIYKFAIIKKEDSNLKKSEELDIVNMEEPINDNKNDLNNNNAINDVNTLDSKPKLTINDIIKPKVTAFNRKNKELDLEIFIRDLVVKFLLGLKDNEFFSLKYLESQRFDFSAIPEEEVKRKEFKQFLLDKRRFYNKSIKILLEKNIIEQRLFDLVLDEIANLYFAKPIDSSSQEVQQLINPTPENQDPDYLAKVKELSEAIIAQNLQTEKIKKKIKITFVKPDILKKKKDNVIALIRIFPVEDTYETIIEELVDEIDETEPEIEQLENLDNKDNEINDNLNSDDKKIDQNNDVIDNNNDLNNSKNKDQDSKLNNSMNDNKQNIVDVKNDSKTKPDNKNAKSLVQDEGKSNCFINI